MEKSSKQNINFMLDHIKSKDHMVEKEAIG